MFPIRLTYIYNRKKKLNKRGEALIQLRIHYLGETKFLSTGLYIMPKQWDEKKALVKNHNDSISFNLMLKQLEEKAMAYYRHCAVSEISFSLDKLISHLKGEEQDDDFVTFFEDTMNSNVGLEETTIKQHRVLLKYLKLYEKRIRFRDLNYNFVVAFEAWLFQRDNYRGGKLSRNYVSSLLGILKRYTNEAIRKGLLFVDPFIGFRIKKEATEKVYLVRNEIEAIEQLDLSNRLGKVELARTMFIFGCYTGLRFSDLIGLQIKHLQKTEKGLRLVKKPKKTRKRPMMINLPLWALFEGKAEAIASSYMEGKGSEDFLFGSYDNKTYNEHLKEFAELAGISKWITSHASRHTFGMLLQNDGFPIDAVRSLMAHSNVATTEIYSRLTNASIDALAEEIYLDKKGEDKSNRSFL